MGDLPLQSENQSSRLSILGEDGRPISLHNVYLAIPGYIFVRDHIILHPGTHRIAYACPGQWDWQDVSHYIPDVEHTFASGKSYALYCMDGYPHIRESPPE